MIRVIQDNEADCESTHTLNKQNISKPTAADKYMLFCDLCANFKIKQQHVFITDVLHNVIDGAVF